MKNCVMAIQVVNEQANLAAEFLNGGRIELHDGAQPRDVDEDFLPRTPVAVFHLHSPAFSRAKNGRIDLYPVAPAKIQRPGQITWGRAFSADGRKGIDFSVGEREHLFNMVIDKTVARAGEELLIVSFSHTVATATDGM